VAASGSSIYGRICHLAGRIQNVFSTARYAVTMLTMTAHKPQVVTQRVRLGSIPESQFVKSKPFVPDQAQISSKATEDVFAQTPVLNADGSVQTVSQPVELKAEPISPLGRGLVSAAIGAAVSGFISGFNPISMIAGATMAGASGAAMVQGDLPYLDSVPKTVTKPVLDGYDTYSTDSAFIAGRPRSFMNDPSGTQFTFIERIKQEPVGQIQVPTIKHTKSGAASWLIPQALGAVTGALANQL
jgi:hypothetical protein